MYAQIKIDCQTKTDYPSCDDCIEKENCQLRLALTNKAESQDLFLKAMQIPAEVLNARRLKEQSSGRQ